MKKTVLCSTLALFLGLGICATTVQAGNAGPAEIILKTAKARKPAKFPHKKHQDMMECATCHHTKTADGKQGPYVAGQEKACDSCHNKSMANKKLNNFMKAAHARCKTCHKKGYKGKKGPTKCKACHIKK